MIILDNSFVKCAVLLFNLNLVFTTLNKMKRIAYSNASLYYNNQFQRVDAQTITSINLKSFCVIFDDIKTINICSSYHIDKSTKLFVADFNTKKKISLKQIEIQYPKKIHIVTARIIYYKQTSKYLLLIQDVALNL